MCLLIFVAIIAWKDIIRARTEAFLRRLSVYGGITTNNHPLEKWGITGGVIEAPHPWKGLGY